VVKDDGTFNSLSRDHIVFRHSVFSNDFLKRLEAAFNSLSRDHRTVHVMRTFGSMLSTPSLGITG
jgi:hypothetical protein